MRRRIGVAGIFTPRVVARFGPDGWTSPSDCCHEVFRVPYPVWDVLLPYGATTNVALETSDRVMNLPPPWRLGEGIMVRGEFERASEAD